jgi:predicted acylesterase/phospholipase RssA/ABC-type phosphate/phosphonate transport system substrate-binding protein
MSAILPAEPSASVEVRVGIVAYEDFREEYAQFETIFADLAQRDPAMRFKLAVGSYGHVLQWLDRGQIDVAVLTPGAFAGLMADGTEPGSPRLCDYLATVQLPPATTSWASNARRDEGFSNSYQSVCLVSAHSRIKTIGDIRNLAGQDDLELLFVHPLSVSGRAAPMEALRRVGIDCSRVSVRFTYSHSQSIRMLTDPTASRQRVAFVWDDAAGLNRQLEDGVRQLPFPELAEISIPHDVVVARSQFPYAERFQKLLLEPPENELRYRFIFWDAWQSQYAQIEDWLKAAGTTSEAQQSERIALDEIGHLLLQYARSQESPPRVALVLSGGGAKCSYQIGAVSAIEEKLSQLRRENPQYPLDIELVVGTSGGAINSLPVAMGITRSDAGRQALADTWTQLNQCEIIRPPLLIRINMGLWFALLQSAVVLTLVRWRVKDENRRGWWFAAVYTSLAGIEILLGYFASSPWNLLGTNHVLHHTWLWLSFGVKSSAWFLFAIGLGALLLQAVRARRGDHIRLPPRLQRTLLATALLGLPLLQVITIAAFEETLSGGEGMEDAIVTKFPRLMNRYLESEHRPALQADLSLPPDQRLQELSTQIVTRGLLQRDLVITGSCLDQTSDELPSDLYFFAAADPDSQAQPYGPRGLSLYKHPRIMLDVIMGSGSIYPLFPARRISDIPRTGHQIHLVDGGFAHNSPVEAAVLWGATHILLIDVMARGPIERGNFLQNTTSSVRHLHRQAQLLDARSREKVTIFTLSPEPPHICIIDFANNLIEQSIEQGYLDASLLATGATPRFEKEIGMPVFRDVRP